MPTVSARPWPLLDATERSAHPAPSYGIEPLLDEEFFEPSAAQHAGASALSAASGLTAGSTRQQLAAAALTAASALEAAPAPSFGDLKDSFEGGLGLWPNSYGGVAVAGGRARIDCDAAQWSGLKSATVYKLAGSHLALHAYPPAAGGGSVSYLSLLITTPTPGTDLGFNIDTASNGIAFLLRSAFSDPAPVFQTYDPVQHAWLRVREAAGVLSWETSPDGSTWTVQRTDTSPAWVGDNDLAFVAESHRDTGTDDYAELDDVNLPPSTAGSVAMSAASELVTGGYLTHPALAPLSAATGLTAGATRGTAAATALSAASALTGGGSVVSPATAALSAAANLTTAVIRGAGGAATFTAATGLTVEALGASDAGIALAAATGLTAGASQVAPAAVALSGASTLTAGAARSAAAATALTAASQMAVAATRGVGGGAALTAASGLAADTAGASTAAAGLTASSGLTTAITLRSVHASLALSGASGLAAGITVRTAFGTVVLTVASGLTAGTFSAATAATTLAATSALTAGALREVPGAAVILSALTNLSTAGVRQHPAALALSVTTALQLQGVVGRGGQLEMSALAALVAAGAYGPRAAAALSGAAGLSLSVHNIATAQAFLTAFSALASNATRAAQLVAYPHRIGIRRDASTVSAQRDASIARRTV